MRYFLISGGCPNYEFHDWVMVQDNMSISKLNQFAINLTEKYVVAETADCPQAVIDDALNNMFCDLKEITKQQYYATKDIEDGLSHYYLG